MYRSSRPATGSSTPPSVYEYLVYSILVQSLLIHLDSQCADFVPGYDLDGTVMGQTLEQQSDRSLMQPSVMAAHLSRELEEPVLNCFGPAYAADAARLLSLDWLHDERVQRNLDGFV